ncbi:MAG: hypothetical protein CAPSK01_000121 [Candidatus Accumulibacter vicinus]|uniref:Uncharacterized protein n=1 Tax=Candidatus Accumulibacter vicinus TaxID=2954382 RepID=A0A084Y5W4_9PROT|nr:MAG: hypothetical protein CAPSK01_000121 [Candidatus Accumulibacter vicinus]
MAWRGKEGRARRLFDDLAGVHDADAGRHLRDDAEVVGDQQHTHRPFGLHTSQQFEDLRLDGDVERRRRLVGNQQTRLAGQRNRDHHPLFHAARELEGIFTEAALGVGNADRRQQFERTRAYRLPGQPEVTFEHLGQLATDGQHRIEAGCRLLEDHRHAATANTAHFGFRQPQQVTAGE